MPIKGNLYYQVDYWSLLFSHRGSIKGEISLSSSPPPLLGGSLPMQLLRNIQFITTGLKQFTTGGFKNAQAKWSQRQREVDERTLDGVTVVRLPDPMFVIFVVVFMTGSTILLVGSLRSSLARTKESDTRRLLILPHAGLR